jgi:voltage-gated potassium channel
LRPFTNILRLFQGLRHALGQPEVQGAAQLALSLIMIATIFYWLVEGWSLLDAVYFSVVTIATVGYGDLSPHTTLGKLFTIGYIVSGIGIFVAAITALAHATLQADNPREQSEQSNHGPAALPAEHERHGDDASHPAIDVRSNRLS